MLDKAKHVGALERLHCLKTFSSFTDLPAPDLAVLAQYATERFFRKRRTLLLGTEPVGAVHLVVEGEVRVRHRGADAGTLGPGEGVGLLELLARSEEGLEAQAETETLTLEFGVAPFLDILEDHFSILHHLLRGLCSMRLDQPLETGLVFGGETRESAPPPDRELDLAERILFLRRTLPFARGSIATLAELARHVVEQRFEDGERIWSRGDPAEDFLVVVSGSMACRAGDEGGVVRFGPGSSLGALDALAARSRRLDAVSSGPSTALRLEAEHLLDVFEDSFEMAMEYLSVVAKDVLDAMERDAGRRAGTSGPEGEARPSLG